MDQKIYVIDRIEGEYAVCIPDDGSDKLDLPAAVIPDAREGLTLEITFRDDSYSVKVVEGAGRKEKNHNRLRNLFNKSEKGNNNED